MKKALLTQLLLLFAFSCFTTLSAQNITVVPNPTSYPSFISLGPSYDLSGYTGSPFLFKNMLVLQYDAYDSGYTIDASGFAEQAVLQFETYTGGDTLHLIPNPTKGSGVLGVFGGAPQIIFNNLLYFIYIDTNQVQKLASFDGTSITVYQNPDAAQVGYIGAPRILNNQLYGMYDEATSYNGYGPNNDYGPIYLAKFTGTGLSLIPNPDTSIVGFTKGFSVVASDSTVICSSYVNAAGVGQLANFNPTTSIWTLVPNPDASSYGVQPLSPANYNGKLYFQYFSTVTDEYQLMQYDGVNNPTLITNPDDGSANNGGYSGLPIVYDDTLFIQYYNAEGVLQLAKFGGSALTLVPNPDETNYGQLEMDTPIIYNNNLYIFYEVDGYYHIAEYQTDSNNIKVYPNPDLGLGYWGQPIVYDGNLFFIYYSEGGLSQLGYFGGTAINLIANPSGAHSSGAYTSGYVGQPIIWNNLLYLQIAGIPYANAGNLGYFDGSTLPLTYLNFSGQKNGSTSLLKWQTTNEINTSYFIIQRSINGTDFTDIGQTKASGNSSAVNSYSFTDAKPVKGINYYRLKEVDENGAYNYSKIAAIEFDGSLLEIYPNPAHDNVTVLLPTLQNASMLYLYDGQNKLVLQQEVPSNTTTQYINVSKLAAGDYNLILQNNNQRQNIKLIKQ